jgi:hypothetical protein
MRDFVIRHSALASDDFPRAPGCDFPEGMAMLVGESLCRNNM